MQTKPHTMWKARAKNRNGQKRAKSLMEVMEDDLRFSVNHPYFSLPSAERMERIKRLDVLADLVATVRRELER